jgi:hypothetical protein
MSEQASKPRCEGYARFAPAGSATWRTVSDRGSASARPSSTSTTRSRYRPPLRPEQEELPPPPRGGDNARSSHGREAATGARAGGAAAVAAAAAAPKSSLFVDPPIALRPLAFSQKGQERRPYPRSHCVARAAGCGGARTWYRDGEAQSAAPVQRRPDGAMGAPCECGAVAWEVVLCEFHAADERLPCHLQELDCKLLDEVLRSLPGLLTQRGQGGRARSPCIPLASPLRPRRRFRPTSHCICMRSDGSCPPTAPLADWELPPQVALRRWRRERCRRARPARARRVLPPRPRAGGGGALGARAPVRLAISGEVIFTRACIFSMGIAKVMYRVAHE